jgi:large repetitive protein
MKKIVLICLCFIGFFTFKAHGQENCSNGMDDDSDGLIDLNDTTDCDCTNATVGPNNFIANPSFEDFTMCPTGFSELSFATGWNQMSDATSDYFNSCGFLGPAASFTPFPDGQGVAGFIVLDSNELIGSDYLEYLGNCLLTPLLAGVEYSFNLNIAHTTISPEGEFISPTTPYEILDIKLLGNQNCVPSTPVFTDLTGLDGWSEIASSSYTPSSTWSTINFTFTPTVNLSSICFSGSSILPTSYSQSVSLAYFLVDNFRLEALSVTNQIDPIVSLCEATLGFQLSLDSIGGTLQWYKDGIAIIGENDTIISIDPLNPAEFGVYSCVQTLGSDCFYTEFDYLNFTGNEIDDTPDTLLTKPECLSESFTFQALSPENATTYVIFPNSQTQEINQFTIPYPEPYGGNYSTFYTLDGCFSDTLVAFVLENQFNLNLELPNVITTDGDGINDKIDFNEYLFTCSFEISIANRWGNVVFEGNELNAVFDGKNSDGTALTKGVYFYKISTGGKDRDGFIEIY